VHVADFFYAMKIVIRPRSTHLSFDQLYSSLVSVVTLVLRHEQLVLKQELPVMNSNHYTRVACLVLKQEVPVPPTPS
jgi:hypothetical protein